MSQKRVFVVLLAAVVIVIVGLGLRQLMLGQNLSVTVENKGGSGKAAIGGPFTLTDTAGKTVHDTDFRGKYMLVYFGYTLCPDVCPTTLLQMGETLDDLGADAAKIQPIFISVDPLRDTPGVIADYLKNFHEGFVGLTGTKQQLDAVERAYAIYAHAATDDAKKDDDYLVDHSALVYLMGPDGAYRTAIQPDAKPADAAAKIRQYL